MHGIGTVLFAAHIPLVTGLHDHEQAHCGKHHKTHNNLPHALSPIILCTNNGAMAGGLWTKKKALRCCQRRACTLKQTKAD